MSTPTLFMFEEHSVRVVIDDNGDALFVGKDVCDCLKYVRSSDAIQQHCKGAAIHRPLQTAGGVQQMRVLAEADVMRLIVGSNLPAAQAFERLVFEEILPSIRKTGSYTAPGAAPAAHAVQLPDFTDPVAAARAWADAKEGEQTQATRALQLEHKVAALAPTADALDRIVATDTMHCLTDAAKHLQLRPRKFLALLEREKWMYKRQGKSGYVAYQERIHSGDLIHKYGKYKDPETGERKTNPQVMVTTKGLATLAKLLAIESTPRPHQPSLELVGGVR